MKKIAIIGAGPAGLTAAYKLTKLGFNVEVLRQAFWWNVKDFANVGATR